MGTTKETGPAGPGGTGNVTLTLSQQDAENLLTALTHAVHGGLGKSKGPQKTK